MRLSPDQLWEALPRLSPATKVIGAAQAQNDQVRERVAKLAVEVGTKLMIGEQFARID